LEKSGDPLTEEEGKKLAGWYKANFKSVTVSRTDDGKLKVSGIASGIRPGPTSPAVEPHVRAGFKTRVDVTVGG
jgi:hypothetical protein